MRLGFRFIAPFGRKLIEAQMGQKWWKCQAPNYGNYQVIFEFTMFVFWVPNFDRSPLMIRENQHTSVGENPESWSPGCWQQGECEGSANAVSHLQLVVGACGCSAVVRYLRCIHGCDITMSSKRSSSTKTTRSLILWANGHCFHVFLL
jgi:hypothetical protein